MDTNVSQSETKYKNFMKFCDLIFELHLPQIFHHAHRDIDNQSFSKNSQIMSMTFQNV